MAKVAGGYEAEQHEVDAIIESLVGQRDPGEPDESWFAHLSARLVLVAAVAEGISQTREELVADMVAQSSERTVAALLNLSPTRPGQMTRRARARATTGGGPCSG